MPVLRINGKKVEVDIDNEISCYEWERDRRAGDKMIACSPFREENSPSFFVNLETGGWADSGSMDTYTNGNLMTLIGYLKGITPYEAGEYLIDKYGALYDITDESDEETILKIGTPVLHGNEDSRRMIDGGNVTRAVSPYMTKRGISEETQKEFAIGYGEGLKGFTAIPWYTVDGRLANIKYRSTGGKKFFYESGATPVSELVYGLDTAKEYEEVVVVEGEVDALSWWTAGIPSIALGGAHINGKQSGQIIRQGFKRIYLGGDNDKQGKKLNRLVEGKLKRYAMIYSIDYGEEKDANEVILNKGVKKLVCIKNSSEEVPAISLRE